jgi:hypothetical protein
MVEIENKVAVDWEAKNIPLKAYQSCLVLLEKYLLAKRNDPSLQVSKEIAFNRYRISVYVLYMTCRTEFNNFLSKSKDAAFTLQDYTNITTTDDPKLTSLFEFLLDWNFQFGFFRTYSSSVVKDLFEQLEAENV